MSSKRRRGAFVRSGSGLFKKHFVFRKTLKKILATSFVVPVSWGEPELFINREAVDSRRDRKGHTVCPCPVPDDAFWGGNWCTRDACQGGQTDRDRHIPPVAHCVLGTVRGDGEKASGKLLTSHPHLPHWQSGCRLCICRHIIVTHPLADTRTYVRTYAQHSQPLLAVMHKDFWMLFLMQLILVWI